MLTNLEIVTRYHQATNVAQLPYWALGRMIKKLFPRVKHSTKRSTEKNVTLYRGIRWNVDIPENEQQIELKDISQHIPRNLSASFVLQTDHSVLLVIPTDIVCNGSLMMKEVEIEDKVWGLKVRGIKVDLNKIGIDDSYDGTTSSLRQILHQVRQVKICRGSKDEMAFKELVYTAGNENEEEERSRCKNCMQCIPWLCVADACSKCLVSANKKKMYARRKIYSQQNEEAETPVSSTNTEEPDDKIDLSDADVSQFIEAIFPGASKEMKALLLTQRDALIAKDPHLRRWDSSFITMCLNMWLRSPRSYQDLKASNMLILPSGRMLQRHKNKIQQ